MWRNLLKIWMNWACLFIGAVFFVGSSSKQVFDCLVDAYINRPLHIEGGLPDLTTHHLGMRSSRSYQPFVPVLLQDMLFIAKTAIGVPTGYSSHKRSCN